jgi:hypothetical protein
MKRFWSCLGDPSLHMIGVAVLLVYLSLGLGRSREPGADSRLVYCSTCRVHHYPESPCRCSSVWTFSAFH